MLGVSDLAGAAAVALALVDDDEEIAAVLPCDPRGDGELVYLCALRATDADDLTGWLAIQGEHAITVADTVRRAASIVALCETAEEAAGVPEADALLAAVQRSREQAGDIPGLAAALAACEPPARALADGRHGRAHRERRLRRLDRPRAARARCGAAHAATARRAALVLALGRARRSGRAARPRRLGGRRAGSRRPGGPARLADQVGAATGAIEAFASDVVEGYRIPLDEHEETAS